MKKLCPSSGWSRVCSTRRSLTLTVLQVVPSGHHHAYSTFRLLRLANTSLSCYCSILVGLSLVTGKFVKLAEGFETEGDGRKMEQNSLARVSEQFLANMAVVENIEARIATM